MHDTDTAPEYGRIPDACRRYGLSRSRLYLLAGRGAGPVRKGRQRNPGRSGNRPGLSGKLSCCHDPPTQSRGLAGHPMTTPDTLTVIRARGRRLAKLIRADGTVEGYDDAKHFDLFTVPVQDLAALHRLLQHLLYRPDCAVVRGDIANLDRVRRVRRLLHLDPKTGDHPTLREAPRVWLAVDVEGVERPTGTPVADLAACAAEAIGRLPDALRGARCIVQASGSHGIKPDVRLRLWCWLSQPMMGAELKRWFRGTPADPSIFSAAQVIYTAAPLIADGAVAPLPVRMSVLPGATSVPVPPPEALAAPPRPAASPLRLPGRLSAGRYARAALVRAADRTMRADKRHPVVISECCGLARLVDAGMLAESELREVVERAARAAGKDDADEIASCIAWGLAHPSEGRVPEMANGR